MRNHVNLVNLTADAKSSTDHLLEYEEDELLVELGRRADAASINPSLVATFDPTKLAAVESLGPLELEDVREFGRRFFRKASRRAYDVVCGEGESEESVVVRRAFEQGKQAAAAALAAVMVASIGVLPAVAAAVAALIVTTVVPSGSEVLCEMWGERLSAQEQSD